MSWKNLRLSLLTGVLAAGCTISVFEDEQQLTAGDKPAAKLDVTAATPAAPTTIRCLEWVSEPTTLTRTAYRTESRQETYTAYRTESVPETRTYNVTVNKMVPETRTEMRTYCVNV